MVPAGAFSHGCVLGVTTTLGQDDCVAVSALVLSSHFLSVKNVMLMIIVLVQVIMATAATGSDCSEALIAS